MALPTGDKKIDKESNPLNTSAYPYHPSLSSLKTNLALAIGFFWPFLYLVCCRQREDGEALEGPSPGDEEATDHAISRVQRDKPRHIGSEEAKILLG